MTQNTLKWWESKTIWINLVGILLIVLELVVNNNLIPDAEITSIVLSLINILRRVNAPAKIEVIEKSVV